MASQTPKTPAGRHVKSEPSDQPKRGIKNPWIYAGTIVVLAIVIVAFVFVPSVGGSAAGGARSLEFGRYAGKSISYGQGTYFARQVQDLNDRFRQQGLNEQNFQFFAFQVYRGAFERTVIRMAILNEIAKAEGYVTDSRLDELVSEYPGYQENGKFSPQRYHDSTLSEKLTVRDQLRDENLSKIYYDDTYSLAPSSQETAFVKAMGKDTRSIEYAAFPLSSYPDSEVSAWAAANSSLFRQLRLSRISLASSEADANKVRTQIKDNAISFEDAAKGHSKDAYAEKGGDQGLKYFHEIAADFPKKEDAEKLASLKKGELSPVFKTVAGSWTFFRADEDALPANLSDPSLLADARDYMGRFERGKVEDWVIAKAKGLATQGIGASVASFDAASRKAGATPKSAGPFALNYGNLVISLYGQTMPIFKPIAGPEAPELQTAATNEKFLSSAFSLPPGAVSDPIVLGDQVVVFKVKEAGSTLDASSGIELYYPYFFQQKLNIEVAESFLKSPALTDNFSPIFFKYFQPAQPKQK
jgi:parvulin-like peptidyl-prolyl isomerase